ncbi:two component, sigma54 specific, transcriptional regulator, Fis family [Geoalkalibacter ferrihydriticus]|uniref:DNA-binding transcriptional regulator NtrC n=2 Tax=Geoalkalibacter ferrihydriticus TaxID=392333 RepID=A0A0C2HHC2_9BACT|nr:sigma-54 dependent transcriptional regulator [Geoalkalibacter ferrihydriticus]KIH76391.1 transcriptional regulator [Geoalkalibacter ferrihydriticus DSM 17813]SDL92114.1 two component, sigma54 specific, transcriptional regulator, Fis family [Geoalkalibacter ferrihydriticus]
MAIERILIADDEESIRWVLSKALSKKGFKVDLAGDGNEALEFFRKNTYDLAILDIKMPGISGLDLLTRFQEQTPHTLIVIMTAESSMKNAVEAMKRGAYDYITKPFDLDAIDAILVKAGKAAEISTEVSRLKDELKDQYHLERTLIGQSKPMQEVYKVLGKVAPSDVTILITGESGTGKELVARAVHFNSPRLGKPFLALNCAAIPRELLESELFGFEKGAFTGATERKTGKFEQANGGTLFLDEIGDMPLDLQAKLLRVLQEKEITRTGGSTTIPVDVRIVAATNQNLKDKVRNREFREDLFYRLNVVPIALPPLRERRDDIPLLVDYFIQSAREKVGTTALGCTAEAHRLLASFNWPGNVRELENTIQRAALLAPNPLLTPDDFPVLSEGDGETADCSLEALITNKLRNAIGKMEVQELNNLYEMVLHQMERPLIRIVLEKTRGNQVRTAEILGINRNTLRKKIQTLGIEINKEG